MRARDLKVYFLEFLVLMGQFNNQCIEKKKKKFEC